jgi:transketolase
MLEKYKLEKLQTIAKRIKIAVVQMSYDAKSAHLGGSLSCIEILVSLYFYIMKVNPKNANDPNRDRLIFSKGHDSKALYAVLAEKGYFPKKLLKTHEKNNSKLPGHPSRDTVAGIEASTGSLGHGLSIAAGIAYAGNLDKKPYRVYAILSDGECDEGSTWEAILFAGHHKLSNLIAIIDYNKIQSFGYTKDVLELEPFVEKFKSFGWNVKKVNGHNFKELIEAFENTSKTQPNVIIAQTIKGFEGPLQHINKISSHYKPPTFEEMEEVLNQQNKK